MLVFIFDLLVPSQKRHSITHKMIKSTSGASEECVASIALKPFCATNTQTNSNTLHPSCSVTHTFVPNVLRCRSCWSKQVEWDCGRLQLSNATGLQIIIQITAFSPTGQILYRLFYCVSHFSGSPHYFTLSSLSCIDLDKLDVQLICAGEISGLVLSVSNETQAYAVFYHNNGIYHNIVILLKMW